MQRWMFREPALCLGLPVYAFASVIFPLHLGWSGSSYFVLSGYALAAGALFTLADVLTHPGFYRRWPEVIAQAVLSILTIALPAVVIFSIGQAFDRSEENMEDELCAMSGYGGGSDAVADEVDDTVDMTPDCIGQAATG